MHLLGIEHLTRPELLRYLETAKNFIEVSERDIKKVPPLRGKTVINLFLEASTRTRVSFEIAGKRLSADTINIAGAGSSVSKGETLLDTVKNLAAMRPDIVVVRHAESGAPHFLATTLEKELPEVSIVNAGDGMHEHPTQALLDCLTIQQHFQSTGRELTGLKIAIVGDVFHSRVARSSIYAHLLLGNQVRLVGPPALVPQELLHFVTPGQRTNLSISHDLEEGIAGADVVMVLRMQLERQGSFFVPNLEQYSDTFGVNRKKLERAAPDAVVLHPGPINRGIEITSELADGNKSLITNQVTHGVAVRMAVLFMLASRGGKYES